MGTGTIDSELGLHGHSKRSRAHYKCSYSYQFGDLRTVFHWAASCP